MILQLSIHLALAAWLVGPLAACLGRDRRALQGAARVLWTFGCVAFLVHVIAAFELVHGWSHTAALVETARQTQELTGVASGMGLWLNYLFTAFWVLDAAWWWRVGLKRYRERRLWIDLALHGFFVFMVFNATVVFERGAVRVGGLVAMFLIAAAAARAGWSGAARIRDSEVSEAS